MALIKCSECGKEVSDRASACPNCGAPPSGVNTRQRRDNTPVRVVRAGWRWEAIKNATISRVEPDGIVLKTKSGVAKVYFTELPKRFSRTSWGARFCLFASHAASPF